MELGLRQTFGAIDNSGRNPYGVGRYTAVFDPKILAMTANTYEIYHMALRGPSGSTLEVWIDQAFYETTPRGDLNSWDPSQPLYMRGGQTLYFFWSLGGATPPFVTIWCRTPALTRD